MSEVSIIIPNWNGENKLKKHLPSVIKAAKHSNTVEVIVVDDASSDGSVRVVKSEFPDVKLITKEKNSGFSSTVNLGVQKSEGDLVVLLNSDASPKEDFLDSLIPHFSDPLVFSVGCDTGGSFALASFKDGFFWHSQASSKPKTAHKTLWVSGGSGIFRKSIWEELGGLDTVYDPFYEEDLDIGYRAYKRGYTNLWEPKSIVEHYQEEGVISKNFSKSHINSIAQRNQLIFIWKNITSQELISEHKKALLKMLLTHPKYWPIFASAFVKLPDIMKKRKEEQEKSKLTDEEVLALFAN